MSQETSPLRVGAIYLLRGGYILRYQGPYAPPPERFRRATPGPGLAFRAPSEGVQEPAVGYSAILSDVFRKLGPEDVPNLQKRRLNALARNLTGDVEELDVVIAELGG